MRLYGECESYKKIVKEYTQHKEQIVQTMINAEIAAAKILADAEASAKTQHHSLPVTKSAAKKSFAISSA